MSSFLTTLNYSRTANSSDQETIMSKNVQVSNQKRLQSFTLSTLLAFGLFLTASSAQSGEIKKILTAPEKVSEHVYAWIGPLDPPKKENNGYRMNMVFVVGEKSVAVIDTGYTRAMAEEMVAHIRKITSLPIKYAVNANSQPHRYMGNDVFRENGATIITHKDSASRMERLGSNFVTAIENVLQLPTGSVKIPKQPDILIEERHTLDLGGATVELISVGPTHTSSEVIAKIEGDNVIYASDVLCSERLPGVLQDGNVENWIKAFDRLKQYERYKFIPGHGRPAGLKDFDFPTRSYLALLHEHMSKMVEEGVDLQDAINRLDQSRYSKLVNYEELAGRNASWAYLEQESAAFK